MMEEESGDVERLVGVSKSYGQTIFRDLNVSVPSKGLVFVHGPNGSGKSTLLRIMALMEMPDSGEIWLMDEKVEDVRVKNYHIYAQKISYSFQEPLLLPVSVEENLKVPTRVDQKRKEELLEELNLGPLLRKKGTKLSGGEKKRVDVARAVMRDTPLLIMDEPLAFLDPEYRDLVAGVVVEEAGRRAVVVSATELVPEFAENASLVVNTLEMRR